MTDKAVIPALGRLKALAEREGRGLELLCHPGGTERGEHYFDQPHSRYENRRRRTHRRIEYSLTSPQQEVNSTAGW